MFFSNLRRMTVPFTYSPHCLKLYLEIVGAELSPQDFIYLVDTFRHLHDMLSCTIYA